MKEFNTIEIFKGRNLVIATKHSKELVIAPIVEKELEVKCILPSNFDSDLFGTFSGEIAREKDPISTVRAKCLEAMKQTSCDLGIASEGSFGAHPSLFFSKADDEILILIDQKNDFEVMIRELSTETNFDGSAVKTEIELEQFLNSVGFPSHKVILKKSPSSKTEIYKDLEDKESVLNAFNDLVLINGEVYVETDMRAMNNPTRMKVIEEATNKLIKQVFNVCTKCSTPGFSVTEVRDGLPCQLCSTPTRSTLSFIYKCKKCAFVHEEMFPHKKKEESPMYCDVCNP